MGRPSLTLHSDQNLWLVPDGMQPVKVGDVFDLCGYAKQVVISYVEPGGDGFIATADIVDGDGFIAVYQENPAPPVLH